MEGTRNGVYIPKWAAGAVATLLAVVIVGLVSEVLELKTTVAVTESDRFRRVDAVEMRAEIDAVLADHEGRLERCEIRLERLEGEGE